MKTRVAHTAHSELGTRLAEEGIKIRKLKILFGPWWAH